MKVLLFGLAIIMCCAGCIGKQQGNKGLLAETDIVLDTTGSISVGEKFLIYELEYAVDHSIIYNPDDKKWHLFGIEKGQSFIHLTADSLTQRGWEKHESFRFKDKDIWAPHIIMYEDLYYMFYTCIGVPRQIRLSTSKDLFEWEHYSEEPLFAFTNEHTNNMKNKDPMVLRHKEEWIMYYSMMKDANNWVVGYSTSQDLVNWSDPKICFDENTSEPSVESPFVVRRGDYFYLLLSARPWPNGAEEVFRSKSPFFWETKNSVKRVDPWHAAEVVRDLDGTWYLSLCHPNFSLAPFNWNDGLENAESSIPVPGG